MKTDQVLAWLVTNAAGLLGVVFSVLGFFLNRAHTNKVLRRSTYPPLRFALYNVYTYSPLVRNQSPPFAYRLQTDLSYRVFNESDDISVSWVQVRAALVNYTPQQRRSRRFYWPSQKTPLEQSGIAARQSHHGFLDPSLEEFIALNMPSVLYRVEDPKPHYEVQRDARVRLLVWVEYQPAKVEADVITREYHYLVTSKAQSIPAQADGQQELDELVHRTRAPRVAYWDILEESPGGSWSFKG